VAKAVKKATAAASPKKAPKRANKTVVTKTSAMDFIASIDLAAATGEKPTMWGSAIIGFGAYHYKYDSGREGDMCKIGLSPRKSGLVLYNVVGDKIAAALLKKLGKHKVSGGCLHIAKLSDIDQKVLREIVKSAYAHMSAKHG
jgi:hypothetical protein